VDCDDLDESIHPGAVDTLGDGIDSNCDGQDGVAPPGDDDDSAGDDEFIAPENCADGFDNDQDGDIDCADPDCAAAALCLEDCADGLDNDLDGDTDCADSSCESLPLCTGDDDDSAASLGTWFGDVFIYSDADAANFCDSYDAISGSLYVTYSSVTSLDGLACLTSVGGQARFEHAPQLVSVSLPLLVSVGSSLRVLDTPALEVLYLPSLTTLGSNGHSQVVGALRFSPFENTAPFGACPNGLTVTLDALTYVAGDVTLDGDGSLPYCSIAPLDLGSLETIGGEFYLAEFSALQAVSLPALNSLGSSFHVVLLEDVVTIAAPLLPIADIFNVLQNPSLTSIAFPALHTVSNSFDISLNPLLPTSQAEALRDQVQAGGGITGTIDISGNGPG
jgi:hypothetical protein